MSNTVQVTLRWPRTIHLVVLKTGQISINLKRCRKGSSGFLFLPSFFSRATYLFYCSVQSLYVALLSPFLLGAHSQPTQLDRIRLIAELAGRSFDHRPFVRVQHREYLFFQAL